MQDSKSPSRGDTAHARVSSRSGASQRSPWLPPSPRGWVALSWLCRRGHAVSSCALLWVRSPVTFPFSLSPGVRNAPVNLVPSAPVGLPVACAAGLHTILSAPSVAGPWSHASRLGQCSLSISVGTGYILAAAIFLEACLSLPSQKHFPLGARTLLILAKDTPCYWDDFQNTREERSSLCIVAVMLT